MSLAEMVRRHDPDRYFTALFAPARAREALFTLYAFNHELARAQEVAREPAMALIRLQWWREVVEGAVRAHEVASPLTGLLTQGTVPRAPLLRMIEVRESDLEGPPTTREGWVARLRQGPGALAEAAGALLGDAPVGGADLLIDVGAAYGAAGAWRNIAALARREMCLMPSDLLATAGLDHYAAIADPAKAAAALRPVISDVVRSLLGPPRRVPRIWVAAALPGVFARRDISRSEPPGARGAGDRLAVVLAAWRGVL